MNTLVALCPLGAERVTGNEVKRFGWHLVPEEPNQRHPGRVVFTGDDDAPIMANLALRTADRVLLQMAEGYAETFDDLFDLVYLVEWQDIFGKDCKVAVDKVRTQFSMLESARSVQAVVQKAIYTKLGDAWHIKTLPESGNTHTVRVYITGNIASILLDTSGEALHKRGYRVQGGIAPLRETTAAVMLQLALWRRKVPLLDPFCGSGTILAEAALYAYDAAPGLGRHFALETLKIYNALRMKELRGRLSSFIRTDVDVCITGNDIDKNAVAMARQTCKNALSMAEKALQSIGRNEKIPLPAITCSDAFSLKGGAPSGLILTNPPYGKRLADDEEAVALYKKMPNMREHFMQWKFGVLTPCKEFPEYFAGGRPVAKNLKAGNMDTTLYIYEGKQGGGYADR